MKHLRSDYDPIQDPRGLIPEEEPVFLLRAQDISAPATLRFWADHHIENGGSAENFDSVYLFANLMEDWQDQVKKKVADIPEDALKL